MLFKMFGLEWVVPRRAVNLSACWNRRVGQNDVFNVKYLVPFIGDSLDEDANSRANSLQPGEDDADQSAWDFMRKIGTYMSVQGPQGIKTWSQGK
jgi:hypothetical protein